MSFQDIDPLQYRTCESWDRDARELFVIGDPNQSIYGFRGADARPALSGCGRMWRRPAGSSVWWSLGRTTAPTPQILEAARRTQGCEPLHPNCPEGAPVRLLRAGSELGGGHFHRQGDRAYGREASACWRLRSCPAAKRDRQGPLMRSLSMPGPTGRRIWVEMCLRKEGIPYIVAGREGFLEDDKVQGSICFFQYLENPENESAAQTAAELLLGLSWNQLTGGDDPLPWRRKPPSL